MVADDSGGPQLGGHGVVQLLGRLAGRCPQPVDGLEHLRPDRGNPQGIGHRLQGLPCLPALVGQGAHRRRRVLSRSEELLSRQHGLDGIGYPDGRPLRRQQFVHRFQLPGAKSLSGGGL